MAGPTLNIDVSALVGKIQIVATGSNIPDGYTLAKVSLISNEISNNSGFIETNIDFIDPDTGLTLTKYEIGSPILNPGKQYLVLLRYLYSKIGSLDVEVLSNKKSVFITSLPIAPVANSTTIRAEDRGVSINIGSLYTYLSESDGFLGLTKLRVFISKVNSDEEDDFKVIDIDIELGANNSYDKWYKLGPDSSGDLQITLPNDQSHEIAIVAINPLGASPLGATFTFSPKDYASEILKIIAYNKFSDPLLPVTIDINADINVYWSKPDDFDALVDQYYIPVTKYTLIEYQMIKIGGNWVVDQTVNPKTIELNLNTQINPITQKLQYSLTQPSWVLSAETNIGTALDPVNVHYKYTVAGSSQRKGKVFTYAVTATNQNGDSPLSIRSLPVAAISNPESQVYDLLHNSRIQTTTGPDITVYTGDLTLKITTLAALNGTKAKETVVASNVNGFLTIPTLTHKKYRLKVTTDTATPQLILDQEVTAYQQYSPLTATVATTAVALNEWRIKTDDISEGVNTLTELLDLGTRYVFELKNVTEDPLNSSVDISCVSHYQITRTVFASPEAVSDLEVYGINDDFTPTRNNGNPALRIVFKQLSTAEFNGMDVFDTPLEYEIRQGSLPVPGVPRLIHDPAIGTTTDREFVIDAEIGRTLNLYIKVYKVNPELKDDLGVLGRTIEGEESSPSKSGASRSYIPAVTGVLTSSSTDGTNGKLKVSWIRQVQSVITPTGWASSNLQNAVYLFDDTDPTNTITPKYVAWSATNTGAWTNGYQETEFTGLDIGSTYKVVIVAEALYTKGTKFYGSRIRNFSFSTAAKVVGKPGRVVRPQVFPSATSATILYDPPVDLGGIPLANLRYHIVVNKDSINFPFQGTTGSTLLQASIIDVAGASAAVIDKTYLTNALATSRSNAVSITPDEVYKFAMWVVASVGGNTITNTVDSLTDSNATSLVIQSVASVPITSVIGTPYILGTTEFSIGGSDPISPDVIYFGDGLPKPVITATAEESSCTLFTNKPENPPSNLLADFDDGDGLDSNGNEIPIFDTRDVTLFQLETWAANWAGATAMSPAATTDIYNKYGPDGYNFRVQNLGGGQFRYAITFRNLVNGRVHKVTARFSNEVSGYDIFGPSESLSIAAEAPPTVVRSFVAIVDTRKISLSWLRPSNAGGALIGSNSDLFYSIELFDQTGVTRLFQFNPISVLSYEINSTNFPNITDGTTYQVKCSAYYLKGTTQVTGPAATITAVKPNPKPVGSTGTAKGGNGTITVDYILANSTEFSNYPLSKIEVQYRPTGSAVAWVIADTLTSNLTALSQKTTVITSLLLGKGYDVKVVHVPNYAYAQAPPDLVFINVVPFTTPLVIDAGAVTGQNRQRKIKVNTNGSGNITQIIALGRSANSQTTAVLNLSSTLSNLPTITQGGVESSTVAALMDREFIIDFGASLPASLGEYLIVVSLAAPENPLIRNGTDALAYSVTGNQIGGIFQGN